jgi:hypothetical protein
MEQHALKNVNYCLNANIYSHLETSKFLSIFKWWFIFSTPALTRHLWQLETVVLQLERLNLGKVK